MGSQLTCYLDNKLLFTYTDPKPIDAGQVALWTYNNGIMLSRVQIYYQDELQQRPRLFVKAAEGNAAAAKSVRVAKPVDGVKIALRQ